MFPSWHFESKEKEIITLPVGYDIISKQVGYLKLQNEKQPMTAPLSLALHDVVQLRKPHPCGGYEWEIVRLGADIGAVCLTCQRRVLIPRSEFEKRVKKFVSHAPTAANEARS